MPFLNNQSICFGNGSITMPEHLSFFICFMAALSDREAVLMLSSVEGKEVFGSSRVDGGATLHSKVAGSACEP